MRIGIAGIGRIGAFHARTLRDVAGVSEVVVTDPRPDAARRVGQEDGHAVARDLTSLLGRVDALVIATTTSAHAETLRAGLAAGLPTFCEKPVAATLAETVELARLVEDGEVPVQVGFQRRFDAGYRRAREAVLSGELGFVHTVRANTHDQSPPPADYLPRSGGLFRDCSIHDFDALRFVTGREVVAVTAVGANKGADFFVEAGDIDTGAALLVMDDDTLVTVTATRYNGGGHDVRMEVLGSQGAVGVGYDDSLALVSAEPGATYPAGPRTWSFLERFERAYVAELTAFTELVAGRATSACTVADALLAFGVAEACERSRLEGRTVRLEELQLTDGA